MLPEFDPEDRRILKFPAVRPCEDVSPATLLASLISLCHSIIAYKNKPFPTHKRICREVIRQAGILLLFFDETRDCGPSFSSSLSLCFSELHVGLQKIRFLLQDCTREGSRVYMLMKSELVVNEFRVVVRSLAMALDVVHLGSIKMSPEVRELVELLAKQTQKVKIEADLNDRFTLDSVRFMLREFEYGSEPSRARVNRVLGYLGIWSWEDCNMEVKFLEGMMGNADLEEREMKMMSSLMGFLCYCRGVMFEALCNQSEGKRDPGSGRRIPGCLNPEDFRCPISLELMTDPVTISTGQTYDRGSIQKWLKAGHMLCPKTGEKLISKELVPNLALKKLIQQFCLDKGISTSKSVGKIRDSLKKNHPSPSSACEGAMKLLAQFLAGRLTYGTEEQQNKAAYEIRLLAKSNVFNRLVIIEMGNVPPLLDLLTSPDPETQENAIAALLKLSKHPKGQKEIISDGGLMLLISVLKTGIKMESRQSAAATLFYLSSVDKYRRMIGSTREGIPALMGLIKDGSSCGKKNALAAILGLLVYPGNHERALEAGIVPLLVDLVVGGCNERSRSDLLGDSLVVLDCLAKKIDGSFAILQTWELSSILGILKSSVSRYAKEYCVSILLSLCSNGGDEVVGVVAKESSIMPTLYALIADGTSHACQKALKLINLLHQFHGSSSSSLAVASALQKERIVQAF